MSEILFETVSLGPLQLELGFVCSRNSYIIDDGWYLIALDMSRKLIT